MPSDDFFETKLCSPIDMAPRPLSKPPVGFFTSLDFHGTTLA
jgi:hypothetical protein